MRVFLLYVIAEMAVIVGLTYAIGFGWTVLLLVGAFAFGIALAGSQVRRQVAALQRGMRTPGEQVTDSALVALGTVLVVIPGLLTSAAGLLMLAPPTRAVMRPMAAVLAGRTLARRVAFVDLAGRAAPGRGQYVDGEVIDVQDAAPTNLPAVRPKPE